MSLSTLSLCLLCLDYFVYAPCSACFLFVRAAPSLAFSCYMFNYVIISFTVSLAFVMNFVSCLLVDATGLANVSASAANDLVHVLRPSVVCS